MLPDKDRKICAKNEADHEKNTERNPHLFRVRRRQCDAVFVRYMWNEHRSSVVLHVPYFAC